MSQDFPKRKSCHTYNNPGDVHELTFSCYKRQSFLKSETAKMLLTDSICVAHRKHRFDLLAWVFMPEHVHMLISPLLEDYSISAILKSIKYPVAWRMVNFLENRNPEALKYLETGLEKPRYRFWQAGGGYDRNYWSTEEIIQRVDYIHNNPVKRGLVEDPCDWPWSSAREWLTGEKGPIPIDRRSFPIS